MRIIFMVLGLSLLLVGCASVKEQKYREIADNHPFDYFFPGWYGLCQFDSLEEAYEFIKAADVKLKRTVNKEYKKGLAARLIGPDVKIDKPVLVKYIIHASSRNDYIDLDKHVSDLQRVLIDAVAVNSLFMVFYEGRAVSISSFLLKEGYYYDNNCQYETFSYDGMTYDTDYPVGWGVDKAFSYLRKEIN